MAARPYAVKELADGPVSQFIASGQTSHSDATGTGFYWSDGNFNFGEVEFGQHPSQDFTLFNQTGTSQIFNIYSYSSDFTYAGDSCQLNVDDGSCEVVVAPNDGATIRVTVNASVLSPKMFLWASNSSTTAELIIEATMYGKRAPEELQVDIGGILTQPGYGDAAFGEIDGNTIESLSIVPSSGTPTSVFTMEVSDGDIICEERTTPCTVGRSRASVALLCHAPTGAAVGDRYTATLTAQRSSAAGGPLPSVSVDLKCVADQIVPQYSSSAPEQIYVCEGEAAFNELSVRVPIADNDFVLYSAGPPALGEGDPPFDLTYDGGNQCLLGVNCGGNVYPGESESATLSLRPGTPAGDYQASVEWTWQNAVNHTFYWNVDVLAPGLHVDGADSITVDFGEVLIGETAARRVQVSSCNVGEYQVFNDGTEPGFAVSPAIVSFDDSATQEVLVLFQPIEARDYGNQADGIRFSYVDGENVKHTVTINVLGRGIGGTDSEASYYACSAGGGNGGAMPLIIVIGGLLGFRRRRRTN